MLSLLFLCLLEIILIPIKGQYHTSSCQDQVLSASIGWKEFTSPGYPNRFPKQTQCNWIIRAPLGYRVELRFDSFYLLGIPSSPKGCNVQHITVRDILSGITDGRYCGNTQPPTAISTGRRLRVTLESNAIRLPQSALYRGFRAEFRASRQASSLRLRDSTGKWRGYRVEGGDVTLTTTTTMATLPTRDPNEIDDNNNAAIDERNNAINSQNINFNAIVNKQNNELNHPEEQIDPYLPVPRPTSRRTRPSLIPAGKPLPTRSPINPPPRPTTPSRPRGNIIHSNDANKKKSSNSETLIIGAVVGCVVAILLLVLVVWCVIRRKRRKRTSKRSNRRRHNRESGHNNSLPMQQNPHQRSEFSVRHGEKCYTASRRELPQNMEREKFNANSQHHYKKPRDKRMNQNRTGYSKM